ncbi:MAG: alpha-amylase family glycosyl hydrolase [Acidobacteriota bacterium]
MIIFELNTRVYGKRFDKITDKELKQWAALGFDWIWLMGIWHISPATRTTSKKLAPDFEGSPYAIAEYEVSKELGGEKAFRELVERAHQAGLRVMADFVPNHMALDSPLIDAHPEYFIHSNPALRDERWEDYFQHGCGRRLAHGRDPYFAGWTDTVQLDYTHPELRAHQIGVLKRLAGMVDGLRCDMAMLVLRDQIKSQWFPSIDWQTFNYHFPQEFWSEAISTVKQLRNDFIFMAEVYWDKESYLQQLGFDLTYNKKLYDLLAHNVAPQEIASYLQNTANQYLAHSIHFLENHDEERAMVRFGSRQRAAATLSYTILGVPFLHQGQMEGLTEKLPVQRIRPLREEQADKTLQKFYTKLLECVKTPLFREGEMLTLGVQMDTVLIRRHYQGETALVGIDTTGNHLVGERNFLLSYEQLGFPIGTPLRCLDLWTGKELSKVWQEQGDFRFSPIKLLSWQENGAFMLHFAKKA